MELLPPDIDRLETSLERTVDRIPVFEKAGIKRVVSGPITHTPDGNFLLGPAPGLTNYWMACGASIGVTQGPGAGKYLAQWMMHGAAEINMREFDPRRYGDFADHDYAVTKAKEDYLLRHEIPYPHFNRLEGRPVKPSPLYQRLNAQGAVHEEVFGWERPRWFAHDRLPQKDAYSFRRPAWYDAVAREVEAVRERVGVMDISAFSKIDVSGKDAESFVSRMIANRVPRKVGGIVLSHLLNEKGTIEAETTVVRMDEHRFYFVFAAFFELRVRDWLKRHVRPGEDVRIDNISRDYGAIALHGPRSREVLAQLTQAPLSNESFPWLTAQTIAISGANVRALRISYAGELGWELHLPKAQTLSVFDALWSAGQAHGIAHYGSFAMNAMRMEKMFKGASELTNEVTLPEADVMRFVRLDKPGGFIGVEATRQSAESKKRPWQCVQLEVGTHNADCLGGEAVVVNGERIGAVSSGAFGPSVNASLAFAYVTPGHAHPGSEVAVMVLGEPRQARVLGQPKYDPDSERPRS